MPMLYELLLFAAYGRPPDASTEGPELTYGPLVGALVPGGPDVLLWVEPERDRLYATELVAGQLTTWLVSSDVVGLYALLDYDGDGQNNIVGSRDGNFIDVDTNQVLALSVSCSVTGIGDVNGDGYDDLASPFEVWLGSPAGFTVDSALYSAEDTYACPTIYPLGDIDGDGLGDFARASVEPGAPAAWDPQYGSLDLYLGSNYVSGSWSPYWSYAHPTEGAGRALTAADVDADGQQELVVLSGHDVDGGTDGELQILDSIFDPLGPVVVVSRDIGPSVLNRQGVHLLRVDDLDYDGDDEVLAVMENLLDAAVLRIIDAEPTQDGLFAAAGEAFDLPVPEGSDEEDPDRLQAVVGDYDGDGWQDVALLLSWTSEDWNSMEGTIAVWLTVPGERPEIPQGTETGTTITGVPASPPPSDREPPPEGYSCGCSGVHPAGGALFATLLLLCVRRRR